jgi:hypothetical protein
MLYEPGAADQGDKWTSGGPGLYTLTQRVRFGLWFLPLQCWIIFVQNDDSRAKSLTSMLKKVSSINAGKADKQAAKFIKDFS